MVAELKTPWQTRMVSGVANVPTNVFTEVVSVPLFADTVEVLGYGVSPNQATVLGAGFEYAYLLVVGGATVHRQEVRISNGGGQQWTPLRLETGGSTIHIRVLHNQVTNQSFIGFIEVVEPRGLV